MNILVFSTDYKPKPGGIGEYTYQVAKCLRKKGHNVVVLSTRIPGDKEYDKKQCFRTVRVTNLFPLSLLMLAFTLILLVRQHRIECVFSTITHPAGEIAYLVSKFLKFKAIIAVHGYEVIYLNKTFRQRVKSGLRPLRTHVYNNVDEIFTVSSFSRRKLIESGVWPSQISVFNNGVDPSRWERRDLAKETELAIILDLEGRKVVLSISTLGDRKGHDMVLRALPTVIKEVPDLVYLIGGAGPRRSYLENMVNFLNLQSYVRFLGFVPDEHVCPLYYLSDIFVLPSRESGTSVEGFGIVFLEANACKKPVIGGDSGGIPDAVINEKTGLLVDPENPGEIATALIRLLKDSELAEALGNQGYERVKRDLTWNKVVSRMLVKFESTY